MGNKIDKGLLFHDLKNQYYTDFSKLVAEYLSKVPKDLRFEFMMILQKLSSVYGSCYEKYMMK